MFDNNTSDTKFYIQYHLNDVINALRRGWKIMCQPLVIAWRGGVRVKVFLLLHSFPVFYNYVLFLSEKEAYFPK